MNKMILQLHSFFNSLDMKYHDLFMDSNQELDAISRGSENWDILGHSTEENNKFFELNTSMQEYGYISLLLRHISIEGFINDVAIRYLGEDVFDTEIEKPRLKYMFKIETVYFLISKKKFPRGIKLYSDLQDLNSVRNTLVHMKSGVVEYESLFEMNGEKFSSLVNSMMGNKKEKITAQKDYISVVKNTKSVYDDLSGLFYKEIYGA